ncbi:subtilisin family serine protease [Clostridium punense]|uniref:Subtilisin family serine protease n=1 Tax=Clostridium punense TaxID=1054297 RepID=A0ABS4K3N5_9CLOT|nr:MULTISPECIES: S8 family peptidase [Clostridium]EQB89662.1 hypothetical protein M918_19340 [Clostridium sp. BL8]MBP2022385.1 subtilisin family serine protease [Clostridium punense]
MDIQSTFLNGKGVIVGIISTGIDYLNPRFMNIDGSTRIISIWDQTVKEGPPPETFIRGTEFKREDINEALQKQALGEDPYAIVNHKDNIGHGTAIAGIIGGRNLGDGDKLQSVVPECEFSIVKLREAKENMLRLDGIERNGKNIYQDTDISAGIRYFRTLQGIVKRPIVVYLALGSNSGGHGGETVLERYMDFVALRRDFIVSCNTGNQGAASGHASGILEGTGSKKTIPLSVAEGEGNVSFSMYTNKPDKVNIGLTSPTGERLETLIIPTRNGASLDFTIDNSNITVQYFEENRGGGVQRVDVLIRNALGGSWYIDLKGAYISNGRYDLWLLQKELIEKETIFLNPDINITLMTPSTAQNSITTSYYDQRDNSVINESGRGFTRYGAIKPTTTMESINFLTSGLNNSTIVASGAAIAGALLTGAIAMIYQWGIVEKNDIDMYQPKLRSYIISASLRDEDSIYPNQQWGYGRFNFNKLLDNLNKIVEAKEKKKKKPIVISTQEDSLRKVIEGLFISIPEDIYLRLGNHLLVRNKGRGK